MPMKPAHVTSPYDITRAYLLGLPPGTVVETHAADGTWTLWCLRAVDPNAGTGYGFPVERMVTSTDEWRDGDGIPRDVGPIDPLVDAVDHARRLVILERTAPPEPADPVGDANRRARLKPALEAWSYENEGESREAALADLLNRIEAAL